MMVGQHGVELMRNLQREENGQHKGGVAAQMYGWLGELVSRCALDQASAHAGTLVWLPPHRHFFPLPSTVPTTAMLCHVP